MNPDLQMIDIALPVAEVQLSEDRASVIRRGRVDLSAGPLSAVLRGLSPVLVDASVQVTVPGGSAQIAIRRAWEPAVRPSDEDRRARAEQAREAGEALLVAKDALARAQAQLDAVNRELQLYAALVSRAVTRGQPAARVTQDLTRLESRLLAASLALSERRAAVEEARRHREALKALGDKTGPDVAVAWAELVLTGPPGPTDIELRYLLPSALWRPSYEAQLRRGSNGSVSLDWRVQATVWQRSGEDWTAVQVALSTARTDAGARLPPLYHDALALRTRTAEERKTVSASFRDQNIQSTSLDDGDDGDNALPGVDDGGEPVLSQALGQVDLPSDGRPHRVQVRELRCDAVLRHVCVPERAAAVFRELSLDNPSATPLLAGPVTLLIDGAYAGVSQIPFVAGGERFVLSFGSLDDMIVRHTREQKIEKRKIQSDLTWFVERVELYSTAAEPIEIELRLRVPVSELPQVKVIRSDEHSSPGASGPDSHGHLRWKLTLAPGQRTEISHGFRLDKESGVYLPDPW